MVAAMAKDCQELTVNTIHFFQGRRPVFYASLPSGGQSPEGRGTDGSGYKQRLVSRLWDHFVARERPLRNHWQSSGRAAAPIQVVSGLLGRPHLVVGGYPGPAISFSECGGKVWAALSGDGSDIGIDAAGPDEFQGEYPFHRVFHPEELHHALTLAGGEMEAASALLWSAKEAVVKALGCAFHLMDPRHINVYPLAAKMDDGGFSFPVGLSGKALARFPVATGPSLSVRSLPQGKTWLSIALWNRRPADHE
jgi:4'-phosphopantetheinyl transferase superfamily